MNAPTAFQQQYPLNVSKKFWKKMIGKLIMFGVLAGVVGLPFVWVNFDAGNSQAETTKTDREALDAIYKEAEDEMSAAEKEFNATLASLQEVSTKIEEEMNAGIDAAN